MRRHSAALASGRLEFARQASAHIILPTHGGAAVHLAGVLAFDRIGSRIPQLVQIWPVKLFFAVPLMFFIAKAIDIRGAFGVPGTGESIPAVFWGALVVSLVCGFFFVRSLIRPRVVHGSWTPMVHADVGSVTIYGDSRRWTTSYDYLTSPRRTRFRCCSPRRYR